MKKHEKILIIGPAWIGDMVMAQTLFKLLQASKNNCEIHVAAPSWTLEIAKLMPEVSKTIPLPFKHGKFDLFLRYKTGKSLRDEKYTQAIVLPNSLKSALVPFFAKIPKRTGWLGEMRYFLLNDWRKLNKEKLPLMIERFAALGLQKDEKLPNKLPWPELNALSTRHYDNSSCNPDSLPRHPDSLPRHPGEGQDPETNKKILGICPGAEFGPAKRWPAEYFAEVANKKLNNNWEVRLFGGPKDRTITDKIQQLTSNRCNNLAGKTTLTEACESIAECDLVITNDTGLMHIAAALNRNLIIIYGSSSPTFTPPLSNKAKILSLNLPCSPCFKRECPFGHYDCLRKLTPDSITL
ncbi:MAG: lipopolysaccharide heptosyltransferase II [Gammaproteobacteria bacterium]|nr:lipopolysaccharide heptosyltransferase II [Gammaproteobacteria bacterium]